MNTVSDDYIRNFNKSVNEFLDDLIKLVNDKLFNKFYKKIKKLLKSNINTNILINKFIINILPYDRYINERNHLLFQEVIKNEKDNIVIMIDKINNVWSKLIDSDKKNIFDYLLVLSYYSKEYYKTVVPSF